MTSPDHETPTPPGYPVPPSPEPMPGYQDSPTYPTPPGYGSAPGYGPPGGYRPPAAQPGIIPLRPIGLGEILDGAFRAIRANPRVMFGLTALVVTVTVALQTVVQWYVGGLLSGPAQDLTEQIDPSGDLELADSIAPLLAQLFTLPAISLATTVLTGLLIVAVSRAVLGRTVTIGEVWSGYRGRVGLVVLFTLGFALATAAIFAAFVALIVVVATNGAEALAVVLALGGSLLLVVASFWLLVRTLLIPAALMLEGAGFGSALARGWKLTRGSYWRLLGIYLLTSIIVSIVNAIIAVPATAIATLVAQGDVSAFSYLVIVGISNIIALTLTTVFTAAVVALLYIDVRMRREGLDVELARAAGEPGA